MTNLFNVNDRLKTYENCLSKHLKTFAGSKNVKFW